ncbi:MAG: hypothetical protein AAFV38_01880, partial [Pseudomonadota bacterium]
QYLDGAHYPVEVSWMAATAGDYMLEDGRKVSFGSTTAQSDTVVDVDLSGFDGTPIISAQVASANGNQAVTTRIDDVTESGFSVNMQEEEASNQYHVSETIHWMAVEEGQGLLSAAYIDGGADFEWTDTGLEAPAHFVADMQSINDSDVAILRFDEQDEGNLLLRVQEEASLDDEIFHEVEEVGVIYAAETSIALHIA